MKHIKNFILPGIYIWLIPFVLGFFFYTKEGKPLVDVFLIKSIMIVVGISFGCYFLIRFFNQVQGNPIHLGYQIGLYWLLINWLLDFLILMPMSGLSFSDYMMQIGIRYLSIPIISITMGYLQGGLQEK